MAPKSSICGMDKLTRFLNSTGVALMRVVISMEKLFTPEIDSTLRRVGYFPTTLRFVGVICY